jgi:RND family efflux transporter MFP subunit
MLLLPRCARLALALTFPAAAAVAQPASAPPAAPASASAPIAAAAAASAGAGVSVQARALRDLAIRPQREVTAVVVARNESRLAAEVAGTVLRWTAEAGATVKRGELLVQIDPTDYRLALERAGNAVDAAQARVTLAESQLARTRDLVAQNFLSQEALVARETEARLARAELASAKTQHAGAQRSLARTQVRSPFAAHVKQRLAQAGEYVAPGAPLYVLSEAGAAELSAQIAPSDLASLSGSSELLFEAQGRRHAVKLLRTGGTVNATSRTREVRVAAPPEVPAGTEGRLIWRDARAHLPAASLVRRGGQLGVFTVQGGVARFVALPQAQEGRAEPVPASLPPSTLVVHGGQEALQDRQAVSVAPAAR